MTESLISLQSIVHDVMIEMRHFNFLTGIHKSSITALAVVTGLITNVYQRCRSSSSCEQQGVDENKCEVEDDSAHFHTVFPFLSRYRW